MILCCFFCYVLGYVCYIPLSLMESLIHVYLCCLCYSLYRPRDTAESFTSDARMWVVSGTEKEEIQSVRFQVALQGWARA